MNSEVVLIASKSDGCGACALQVSTCTPVYSSFKNCIVDAGTMCKIAFSASSYSGSGSCGDFLAMAQSGKTSINIYQWGKPQVHMQCHTQEIVTALCSDPLHGNFLIGGTKRGWIYVWDVSTGALVRLWQAHFKSVKKLLITKNSQYCISVSEEGMAKAFDLTRCLEIDDLSRNNTLSPYKSWSPHTLPIQDAILLDSLASVRVVTCSLDKTLVMYDVHSGTQCLRISLPEALESIACNPGGDIVCVGSSVGSIFVVDMSISAIASSAALSVSNINYLGGDTNPSLIDMSHVEGVAAVNGATMNGLPKGISRVEGHTKAVTCLAFSIDNCTLLSGSEDGTLRSWNIWTKQCMKKCSPLSKFGISSLMVRVQ
jgi:pre-rRNA-processing protein IPI3